MLTEHEKVKWTNFKSIGELLGIRIPLLNDGYLEVIDVMGNDKTVPQSARISYGNQYKNDDPQKNKNLTRRLWVDKHLSPFEMPKIQFIVRCPMFVANQWKRHRMANYNEHSLRYTAANCSFYLPELEQIKKQSKLNHQGGDAVATPEESRKLIEAFKKVYEVASATYDELNAMEISRELIRSVLPVGLYVNFITCLDLRSLLNFLELRMAADAQFEIRVYAWTLFRILKIWLPDTASIFEESFYATRLSDPTIKILNHLLLQRKIDADQVLSAATALGFSHDQAAEAKKILRLKLSTEPKNT